MSNLIYSVTKKNIREKMLELRNKIKEEVKKAKNEKITNTFIDLVMKRNIRKVLLYASFGSEVDTWEIFQFCLKNNIKTAFPKVSGDILELYWVENKEQLLPGYKSILEPYFGIKAYLNEIEVITVPGVAFDKRGFRIGWGGGFFDRLLAKADALKIGLAYEEQIIEEIPSEFFDQRVDLIITDEKVINCV